MIGRDGDVAIYKKQLDEPDSEAYNYEVIAIKRHNGYEIAGVKMPPAEMYLAILNGVIGLSLALVVKMQTSDSYN